jgi:5-methylcytosine-specific restriction endonuclease McrA
MLIQFLADEELVAKLDAVKSLLSAGGRGSSLADIVDTLASDYLERHHPVARKEKRDARKGAASPDSRRREWEKPQESRHIPAQIRDDVFARDQGQCTYVAADGKQCRARHGLHVDHITPFSAGGKHEPSNLRLLCAAHNRRAAEHTLGSQVMARFWRQQ